MSEQTWRDFLGRIISNPLERQRIASAVEVKEVTLQRWVMDRANPHPRNLHQLVSALPQFQDVLVSLIQHEFPDFENVTAAMRESVPAIIYSLVLDAYVNHTDQLARNTILSLVLLEVAPHIDPSRTNSFVSLAYCYPEMQSLVVSKTHIVHYALPPDLDLYHDTLLLGAESLTSYVAATCQPTILQDTAQERIFPLSQVERSAKSIAVWPIQRQSKVAGVLIISSRHPYFFTELRVKVLIEYVRLLSLAFHEHDFLACHTLRFRFMPHDQQKFIQSLRSRQNALRGTYPYDEIERITYRHIEAEIAQGDDNER